MTISKNLIWWMYQPNDEREQQLYLQAYKRCSYVFVYYVTFLCIMYCLETFKGEPTHMSESIYVAQAIFALIVGLIWGALVFHNQALSFTKTKRPNLFWLFIRNGLIMCVVLWLIYASGVKDYFDTVATTVQPVESSLGPIFGMISFVLIGAAVGLILYHFLRKKK